MIIKPKRGDIWLIQLDPTVGHEQTKKRPCLVISSNILNNSHAGLVIIIPLTSKRKNIPSHITILPPEGGIIVPSFLMCEQIRSVSINRFSGPLMGSISEETLKKIEYATKTILEFF